MEKEKSEIRVIKKMYKMSHNQRTEKNIDVLVIERGCVSDKRSVYLHHNFSFAKYNSSVISSSIANIVYISTL